MEPALAYLDAGTGSLILQMILGGAAAVAVTVKFWGNRLLQLLHIRRRPVTTKPEQHGE